MSDAVFYDCSDSEEYSHTSPEECLEEFFEAFLFDGGDTVAEVTKRCPIMVTAYARDEVPAGWAEALAARLAEDVEQDWTEEYGPPDGLDGVERQNLQTALQTALEQFLDGTQVWSCHKIGSQTYSLEEVLALLRESHPDWFEYETAPVME